jgi:hypothetical protein
MTTQPPPAEGVPPTCRPPSYLSLVVAAPSPHADWLPVSAPPTPLEAAQRRLAFAGMQLPHEEEELDDDLGPSLSTGSELFTFGLDDVDIAAGIGPRVRGVDHFTERERTKLWGGPAATARAQLSGRGSVVQVSGRVANGEYDGQYSWSGEFEGWPHFASEIGNHLYYYLGPQRRGPQSWRIGPTFSPSTDSCVAFIPAPSGSLPVGPSADYPAENEPGWLHYVGADQWVPLPELRLDILPAGETLSLWQAARNAALARQRSCARAQLRLAADGDAGGKAGGDAVGDKAGGDAGLLVVGAENENINGAYLLLDSASEDGSFLHFQNEAGSHFFRYQKTQSWRIGPSFSPNVDSSIAFRVCPTGALPLGTHTWQCFTAPRTWESSELTVVAIGAGSVASGGVVVGTTTEGDGDIEDDEDEDARAMRTQAQAALSRTRRQRAESQQASREQATVARRQLFGDCDSSGGDAQTAAAISICISGHESQARVNGTYCPVLASLADRPDGTAVGDREPSSVGDSSVGDSSAGRSVLHKQLLQVQSAWPRFRNEHGYHLYRFQSTQSWRVGPSFSPENDCCSAFRVCETGALPLGDGIGINGGTSMWQCFTADGEWAEGSLTLVLQTGSTVASDRTAQLLERESSALSEKSRAANAREQVLLPLPAEGGREYLSYCPVVLVVSGLERAEANGRFTMRGIHEGYPHFSNGHQWLFRFLGQPGSWRIGPEFCPDDDSSIAYINDKTGKIPLGTGDWMCYRSQQARDGGNPHWVERQVMVIVERDEELGAVAIDSRLAQLENVGASLCALLGVNVPPEDEVV